MNGKSEKRANTTKASRRRFAKAVGAVLIAAPLTHSIINAQTPSKTKQEPAPPNPQPSPTPQKPSPLAEAYMEVARIRFGDKTRPEQFEQIKKDLEGNVRAAERLRNYKLKNGDEPDFIFSAS